MSKLIDNQLEDLDRRHLELTMLNEKILDSLKMYDKWVAFLRQVFPERCRFFLICYFQAHSFWRNVQVIDKLKDNSVSGFKVLKGFKVIN